jgi:hypothetical protein
MGMASALREEKAGAAAKVSDFPIQCKAESGELTL